MSKTKEDLETRIKELEELVGHYKYLLDEKQSQIIELKNDLFAEKIKNIPLYQECIHDWDYNFNTTAPYRQCRKCFKYEPQFLFNTWWGNTTNTTTPIVTIKNFPINNETPQA